MTGLSHSELVVFFFAVAVLLTTARLLGELAKALNQPSVIGEILAGIILGPTVLGHIAPSLQTFLFPAEGNNALILSALSSLAVTLFLLIAGIEVDLSSVFRQGKATIIIGITGLVVPMSVGFALGWWMPLHMGREADAGRFVFALFLGTALSVSALPVIAKTLLDLKVYRSDFGMTVVSVAILHDLIGWMIFAIVLVLMGVSGDRSGHGGDIATTVILTLLFVALMLTVGRWIINKALIWTQAKTSWPGGVLGFAVCIALIGAAITEWIGIHAIFGAFFVGVALGDSPHLKRQTRTVIENFISYVFAPLFFASIGLQIDFIRNFDWQLVLMVFVVASFVDIFGSSIGARMSGMPPRQSLAIGFALNARGAMEIILALLALQFGVISEPLFVALVIMAIVTSMLSGPMVQLLLKQHRRVRLQRILKSNAFVVNLQATTPRQAISELVSKLSVNIVASEIEEKVREREQLFSTALSHGVAAPHARIDNLKSATVALGISKRGIDFDAPDGQPARLIFLFVTPAGQDTMHLEILREIAILTSDASVREDLLAAKDFSEVQAVLKRVEVDDSDSFAPSKTAVPLP